MKQNLCNIFFWFRRSTPANMYDLIDQCHQWNNSTASNLVQPMEDYTDGFWKVFLLNDKTGGCSHEHDGTLNSKSGDTTVTSCHCMKHSKTARRRRFKSQSGYYLSIMPNGQILGVKDPNSPYSKYISFIICS